MGCVFFVLSWQAKSGPSSEGSSLRGNRREEMEDAVADEDDDDDDLDLDELDELEASLSRASIQIREPDS